MAGVASLAAAAAISGLAVTAAQAAPAHPAYSGEYTINQYNTVSNIGYNFQHFQYRDRMIPNETCNQPTWPGTCDLWQTYASKQMNGLTYYMWATSYNVGHGFWCMEAHDGYTRTDTCDTDIASEWWNSSQDVHGQDVLNGVSASLYLRSNGAPGDEVDVSQNNSQYIFNPY